MPQQQLICKSPATDWRDAFPLGNGEMGAMPFGNVCRENILLNHEALWVAGQGPKVMPELSVYLPEVRRLLDAGDYAAANALMSDKMVEAIGEISEPIFYPLARIVAKQSFGDAFRCYERVLHLDRAEQEVRWRDGEIDMLKRAFVSHEDGCGHAMYAAQGDGKISVKISICDPEERGNLGFDGSPVTPLTSGDSTLSQDDHGLWVHYRGQEIDAKKENAFELKLFGVALCIKAQGGSVRQENGHWVIDAADTLELIWNCWVGGEDLAKASTEKVSVAKGYTEAMRDHLEHYGKVYQRVQLDLDDANVDSCNEEMLLDAYQGELPKGLVLKMFNFGRYLLLCSSGGGRLPAHLQGLWNGDFNPPWNSFYMNNENTQMNYWQALPGNMAETTQAYFKYFEDRLGDYRQNAKRIYGCRGILIPPYSADEGGLSRTTPPHCLYWTGAAGWLSALFFDYYLYTEDLGFLKERALPFLEEVAQFYLDFLVENENGQLKVYPSNSPENVPKSFEEMEVMEEGRLVKKRISVAINATMDFAIAKEVFSNVLESYRVLNMEGGLKADVETALSKIPPYEVNEGGAIREWLHSDFVDNDEHRHESHVYPAFPGFEVTAESNPKIFKACQVALQNRKVIGLKDQTGWSLVHMANACARMGNAQQAHRALEIMSQTCLGANLFTYHNDDREMGPTFELIWGGRPPFQIDANLGYPAAIFEMLCFSKPGLIKLLPSLPSAWQKGSIRGLVCRGGIQLDMNWSPTGLEVSIMAQRDQEVELLTPFGARSLSLTSKKTEQIVLKDGKE
jgi:alpha-L-fucosidase 2